uniref:V-type proton ATPase subunit a n=1 Tax=Angiostrongylus cantonensis TaxID=6313 RepID=A0A158P9R6_ANGCA
MGSIYRSELNAQLNPYQRKFVNEIRRCEEMERKLHFIEAEVLKDEIELKDYDEHIPAPPPRNMLEMETNFEKLEEELLSINASSKQLMKNYIQLNEMKAVLENVQHLLDASTCFINENVFHLHNNVANQGKRNHFQATKRDAAISISEASKGEAGPFTVGIKSDIEKERRDENELKFITGVISRHKVIAFERFIWRFCRGKVFVRTVDIAESMDMFELNDMQSVISKTLDYRRKIIFAASLSVKKWAIMWFMKMAMSTSTTKLVSLSKIVLLNPLIAMPCIYRGSEPVEDHADELFLDSAAPWSIISFPFLFAVMFGDSGHGVIMFFAALLLVVFERKLISMKIKDEGPYPFGVDPIWNVAKNKLNFLNPLKMKTSIILGISQMAFGLILSLCNHMYNRSLVDVLFVFIPQCFFLSCIFVYLCLMVVLKWIFFYVNPTFIFGRLYPGSNCAPSLLIGLINISSEHCNLIHVLHFQPGFVHHVNSPNATASVVINNKNYTYDVYDQCYLQQWYPGQGVVEEVLLGLAVISIPIMLLVKPFYMRSLYKRGLPLPGGHNHGGDGAAEEFSFADVMVYQAIHTIEFALGCISHTASYLRLWALSLAHAQLSEVLWDMLLAIGLTMGGWAGSVAIFILYFFFGVLSISILILMEGLSAFLHALRLHWVEFNSKFYGGTGVAFEPFYFTRLIRIAEGLEQ